MITNTLVKIKHLFAGLFFFTAIGLSAQSIFNVTNTNDAGPSSLRQAITDANANGDGLDVINFYFSDPEPKTILLQSQLPIVTTGLTINGLGEDLLAISGQDKYRILFINSTGDVNISDLTLRNGKAQGGNGGNGSGGAGGGAGMGGAIFLQAGNLNLEVVSIINNQAIGGNGGFGIPVDVGLVSDHRNGSRGGSGPFGIGGAGGTTKIYPTLPGQSGDFGAGGGSGARQFGEGLDFESHGGSGGYGAGAGSLGSAVSCCNDYYYGGTNGEPGKFGGQASLDPTQIRNGNSTNGGGGAGLGAGIFIYGGSITLNAVLLDGNKTRAGNGSTLGYNSSLWGSNGQAKAAGIFHYGGIINNNGIVLQNNTASNALNTGNDNPDFYSETGLTLAELDAPTITRSTPGDGEASFQKFEDISITLNENILKADGSTVLNADLSSLITFKETNASGADVAFTASVNLNKMRIELTNSLTNGATYYIGISGIEDRYGNELTAPETITFTVDGEPPVFTADPPSGSTLIGRSFTFTADEDIYNTDGSDIDPSELINIAKVRLDNALGAIVSTSATKVGNAIQISLDQALPEQIYHVTFENIADANGNVTAPQVFTYTRPAFADAKIRVNPSTGNELATRAIEVTFDEDYYVEVSTGSFSLFNTRTYSQAYTDAVLDLKLNDENGTDIIDRWSFDADGKLYILNDLAPSSTYYLQIANLFTADQKPVEALEMTFTTPDTFNPVKGSGYAASFNRVYLDQNESLGTAYSAEFAIKIDGSTRYKQALFWGYSPSNTEQMVFWLNDDKLTLSKVDASYNVVSDQSIESSVITGFDSYQEVGFTYDNGSIVLYHNGVAVGSGTIDFDNYKLTALGIPSPGSITGSFGTVNFSERFFLFTDEIRIWNTALTAQTILDGINTPITTSHAQFADLKHLWTFDENGGKLGYDAKTGIANLCFSCAGTTPRWEASNRRDEPLIEIALGGEMLAVGDEISFLAGNGGQLQKTLTITNTGSLPLELLGEAYVADFEGRFTIDYSDTETTIAPGASTNFMITFQSNDVRTYNTSLTIPNNSLDNSFELSLKGTGISATSGNWQTFGTPGELPQIFDMWAHDGKLTITAELVEAPNTRFVVDVTENAGGGLSYSTPTYISKTVSYGSQYIDLMGDGSGNYYVQNSNNIGEIKNLITNEIQTYGMNTTHDDFTDGELKTDRNGVIHYLHSYYDGAATNSYGLKIEKGHPATETITLTFEDLVNFGGTINNGTEIRAYSMAFDSNNDLYVTLTTNESNPEPRQYILKYNSTTGWDDFGYDSFSAPYRSNVYSSSYNELIIDENDFLHIGTMNSPVLRYQKFTPDGILIEGGELWNNTLGLYYPGLSTYLDRNRFFGLGAAGEPMFISKTNNSGISSVVYEAGGFSLFNEQYITGSDPGYFPSFFCSIDQQTGQPYIVKNGSGNNSAHTMQGISPELSVAVDGHALQRETTFPLQIGVGTAYEFDMTISNSGFTNLHLKGDPLLTFAGDKAADLSYETEGLPSILKIGESVTIPITFAPKTIYTKSELVVNLPTNSPNGDFEFSILLSSLDNTNTGEWTLHTDVIDPPYNDVDMRIGNFNQPNYTYNTYQEVTYTTGTNAGTTIPYARLESYDVFKGAISFDPDILDENVSLPTAFPLPHYFRRIQVASSPTNQINYFAHEYKQSGTFYKGLFSANPASGKTPVGSAESSARMDYEFGSDGTRYELYANPNGLFTVRNAGEFTLNFTGQSISSEDLDLEVTDDFAYAIRQYNSRAWVYKAALGANATDPASVTIFDTGDNGIRVGNIVLETHTKDLEVFGDKLYIAFVNAAKGISLYVNETTTTQLPSPSVTNVVDLQLQIHPDGTPYISYIEDLDNGQFPVSVIKLVDGVWETVGTPRFSYGDYDTEYTVAGDQPIRPALRAPFQINDLGELFVFYGDIYSIIEEPATFNHLPVFTSTPVTEANEGEEYLYEIAASDSDLDALTFGTSDLPEWLTLTDNGDGTASISGTPTDEDATEYAFSVTISDGSLTILQEVSLIVNDLNTAPTFDQPVATIAIDQDTESYTLDLTGISDGDVYLEQDLSLSATLDNNYLIRTIFTSVNEDGTGSLFIQPFAGESGVVTITLTLMDDGDPALSESYNVELTINPIIDPNAIQVTNLNDSGDGSLRAAIEQANSNPDHDVIDMRLIEGQIDLQSSLPVLTTNMDIVGVSHAQVTVDGGSTHQVFYVTSGNVLLKGFQVANGFNSGGNGTQGSGGGGGGAGFGGAVFLDGGNLIVNRMNFTGNVAIGGNGGNGGTVNGGNGGSSIFGDGGAGGAAGNYGTHGAAGAAGPFYGTGGGGGEKGFSGFSGGKGGEGNFGGGAGGGAGVSSGSSYGNPGSPGTFGGNAGKANNGGAGGGGAGLGGAIYAKFGSLIVNETTFTSNAATGGSKGTNSGSTSVLQPTNGFGKGGAIFVNTDVPFSNLDNTFSSNAASAHEGIADIDDANIYTGSTATASRTLLSTSYIDENQSGPGLVVAMISTFTGNPADYISYNLNPVFGDNSSFVIVDDELQLADGIDLDFEVKSTYSIQISTIVNSVAGTQLFTITVNDLNDPATDFDLSEISLDEGQEVGTVVGAFSATDEDLTNTHIYSLVSGFGDNDSFQIAGDQLQVAEEFDFDDKSSYSIQVELDDSGVTLTRDFTITVNNINVAPTAITLSNSSIPENSQGDFLIGSLSAVDSDDQDTHTFGFTGGAGLETAEFKLVNGDLYTNRNFDFETESSLQVEIYARDNNAESVDQVLTITITDANDVPTSLTISSSEVEEAQPVGTEIGILSAFDQDASDIHTFTLVSGFGENYAVNIVGNSLQTAIELDFDVLPALDLKINVNDGNGGVNEFELTITVTNVNQAPTAITISNANIDEDATVGSIIGTLSTTDPDVDDTHTYEVLTSIEYEGTTIFPIVADGANLVITVPLDFETLSFFVIDVQVTDAEGLTFTETFTISTNNVNEVPTSMTLSTNAIAENTAAGFRIGQLDAVDPDANDPLTYSLVSGEGDEGNASFQIGGVGNELENAEILDFETQSTYSVRVRATDAGGLFYEQIYSIEVTDTNDSPTGIELSSQEIAENTDVGTVVGSFTAIDQDMGDTHTFIIDANYPGTQFFTIDGSELKVGASIDFESTQTLTIGVVVNDADGDNSFTEEFEISVTDTNDAPTAISLSRSDIDEDAAAGSVIGVLTTTDQDANDTHTYEVLTSIVIDGNTVFPVIADGDNLITTGSLDYETYPFFPIEVQVTDAEGLTLVQSFTLSSNDVNEAPTALTLSGNTIAENIGTGLRIGQLIGTDPDFDSPLIYTLVEGEGDEGNASFQIGGPGNELENAVNLDYETQSTYSVRVRVTDLDGLFFEQVYSIEVIDTNDAPTAIALSSNSLEENKAAGTVIGSFSATDEDADAAHSFTLVSGFGANSDFSISNNELISAAEFDFETKDSYSIKVKADDGAGGSFDQEFTIDILNVTEGVSQTITFDPLPSKTFGDEAFELTATASSGLEVVYTSSNEAIVSISGNTATILAVGEVTIIASQSGVEGTFEAANPVSQVLTVNRASQTITFDAIADQVAGADPITLVASSTSGLEVSFSVTGAASLAGNTLTITGVGEVIVTASQLGSDNHEAATDVVRSFVVNDPVKTDQTITFNPPSIVYVTDEAIELQATSDSGLEVAFEVVSGSEYISQSAHFLNLVKAGTVSVRAYQVGDDTFNPASVVKQIVIKPVFTVSGTVTDENGEAFTEGVVGIINAGKTGGTGTALDAAGNYTFSSVKEGIYYVGVIPNDETTYYTTAYGDAIIYQNATPINLTSDVSSIDIQMVVRPNSTNELTGDGEVTGRVIEDDGTGNRIEMGSILEGVAIEGASIFLIRKSDDKILTEVFSDVNGDFKISGIPEGSFSILINIPGVEGNVSSDITVKKGTKVQMTAMVGEDGIVFETEVSEVLGLDDLKWTMYPNPAQDFIKLEVDGRVTFRILSINGMSIEGESFENETSVDIKALKPGIYFLELIKDGKVSVQKFIKVN